MAIYMNLNETIYNQQVVKAPVSSVSKYSYRRTRKETLFSFSYVSNLHRPGERQLAALCVCVCVCERDRETLSR